MEVLPAEIKEETISYLSADDLFNMSTVSNVFRVLAMPHLWKRVDKKSTHLKGMLNGMLHEIDTDSESSKASGHAQSWRVTNQFICRQMRYTAVDCAP